MNNDINLHIKSGHIVWEINVNVILIFGHWCFENSIIPNTRLKSSDNRHRYLEEVILIGVCIVGPFAGAKANY